MKILSSLKSHADSTLTWPREKTARQWIYVCGGETVNATFFLTIGREARLLKMCIILLQNLTEMGKVPRERIKDRWFRLWLVLYECLRKRKELSCWVMSTRQGVSQANMAHKGILCSLLTSALAKSLKGSAHPLWAFVWNWRMSLNKAKTGEFFKFLLLMEETCIVSYMEKITSDRDYSPCSQQLQACSLAWKSPEELWVKTNASTKSQRHVAYCLTELLPLSAWENYAEKKIKTTLKYLENEWCPFTIGANVTTFTAAQPKCLLTSGHVTVICIISPLLWNAGGCFSSLMPVDISCGQHWDLHSHLQWQMCLKFGKQTIDE